MSGTLGSFYSSNFTNSTRTKLRSFGGRTLVVDKRMQRLLINNAQVTRHDFQASNGVLHFIDRLLVPHSSQTLRSTPDKPEERVHYNLDAMDLLQDFPMVSVFLDLLERSPLVSSLREESNFTMFIPTDRAFDKAIDRLSQLRDPHNPIALRQFLEYHVVPRLTAPLALD